MGKYKDGYENGDPQLEMILQSSKWSFNQANDLFEQYKKCQTDDCREEIFRKLVSARQRMNYDGKILTDIIKKAEEDGI